MNDGYTDYGRVDAEGNVSVRSAPARASLEHKTVVPPRCGAAAQRLDSDLLDAYRRVAVPDVSDAVGRLYTMDCRIGPLYQPMRRIVGVALTVKAPPGDNWAIYGALGKAQQDDVLIVDWQGYSDGCGSGVNGLMPAIGAGLAGVIVDGGWRDVGDLQTIDFPVHGRCISPFSPSKCELGEINVPVCCGGVIVEPGDVVVADREGAAVVPRRHVEEVARLLQSSAGGPEAHADANGGPASGSGKITDAYLRSLEDHGGLQGNE